MAFSPLLCVRPPWVGLAVRGFRARAGYPRSAGLCPGPSQACVCEGTKVAPEHSARCPEGGHLCHHLG